MISYIKRCQRPYRENEVALKLFGGGSCISKPSTVTPKQNVGLKVDLPKNLLYNLNRHCKIIRENVKTVSDAESKGMVFNSIRALYNLELFIFQIINDESQTKQMILTFENNF